MEKFNKLILLIVVSLLFFQMAFTVGASEILNWSFEDQETGNWLPRGNVNLKVVEESYQGDFSLLTTERSNNWNGPSINLKGLVNKGKYNVSIWVKLPEGQSKDELIMTIEKNDGTNAAWDRVAGPVDVGSDEWVELEGEYTFSDNFNSYILYIESPNANLAYYIDEITITPLEVSDKVVNLKIEEDLKSLAEVYQVKFLVGAALEPYQLKGEHARLLSKHFNTITAENVMKPVSLQAEEGDFSFAGADSIIKFAEENNMQVRGHTLLWHQQSPNWFFVDANGNDVSRQLLLKRLKNHIQTVVGRYKGKVYAWDVVNEVIDTSAIINNGLRNSKWYQFLGEEYIVKAFEYAREADPDAKLFINDYSLVSDSNKRNIMYNLVKRLKEKGVPIDGIGMQMHVNILEPRIDGIEKAIEMFTSLGVELHITELDMSLYEKDSQSYDDAPEELLIRQGHRYKELFDLFEKYDSITSVTLWGIADDHTWLTSHPVVRNNWPLLFDKNLKAKYAYWGVVNSDRLPVVINKAEIQQGSVIIDGNKDKEWDNVNAVIAGLSNEEIKADIKTMWEEDGLYILAQIQDESINEDDSITIYIDENNDKTSDYQQDDYKYVIYRDGNNVGALKGFVKEEKGKYITEIFVPFKNIEADIDTEIGFDIKLINADTDSTLVWNDYTLSQENSTKKFGVFQLKSAPAIIRAVKGSAKIDAEFDTAYQAAKILETNVHVEGVEGATAKVWTMWDENHLYIYADVIDSLLSKESANSWEQDSVEIFIDENNNKSTTYEDDDSQYRVNFVNEQSFDPNSLREGFVTATKKTDTGYIVEAAIEFMSIKADEGMSIGFDFQVNDDQGDGSRASVLIWSDSTGNSWKNTSGFGNLIFGK